MTTLQKMKDAICRSYDWCDQRGPDDYDGYLRDCATRHEVAKAKTWQQLANCAPSRWSCRIADRSLLQNGD